MHAQHDKYLSVGRRGLVLVVLLTIALPAAPPALVGAQTAGRVRIAASTNWTGYTVEAQAITLVHAAWTIPAVKGPPDIGYSSVWVGIGGKGERSLIQAGTSQEIANGETAYYMWVEMLPDAATPLPRNQVRARPGDAVGITIRNVGGDDWTVKLENTTSGQKLILTYTYASCKCSAEWIAELPTLMDERGQQVYPDLANFGSVRFSDSYAEVGGVRKSLRQLGVTPVYLRNRAGQVLATPGDLSASGNGFTVTYGANGVRVVG